MNNKNYILITAAKNEENYIEETIQSVISQTITPVKWIIVSDGSTDRTDEIVKKYLKKILFIELIHIRQNRPPSFASKVHAFREGYKKINCTDYNFLGNLDGDISFSHTFYEDILGKFQTFPKLGIAGGFIYENSKYGGRFGSRTSNHSRAVAGAIQFFRRDCYETLGGYIPLEIGGIDWYLNVLARKNGWEVKTFPELIVNHHRITGTKQGDLLKSRLRQGKMDYSFGSHPLFEIIKCFRRIKEKPYLLSAIFRLYGFVLAILKNDDRVVSDEFIDYLRKEQKNRLWHGFKSFSI